LGFCETTDVLEAYSYGIVELHTRGDAPRSIEYRRIVLIDLRWEVIPTRLEDIESLKTRVGHPPGPNPQLGLTNRHGQRQSG